MVIWVTERSDRDRRDGQRLAGASGRPVAPVEALRYE